MRLCVTAAFLGVAFSEVSAVFMETRMGHVLLRLISNHSIIDCVLAGS
jgi:hypothetical protein